MRKKNILEDVWKRIDKRNEDECWEWKGCLDTNGYGRIGISSKLYPSHRLVYELTYGEILNELFVLHKCDNPKCCNPNHLFLGTQVDNIKDMISKGRNAKGNICSKSNITEKDVLEIRKLYQNKKYSQYEIAKIFNVNQSTIQRIINKKIWKHI